jgi:hypothetical protein
MEDQNQNQAPGNANSSGSFVALGSSMSNQPAPADQTTQALPAGVTFGDTRMGGGDSPSINAPDGLTFGNVPMGSNASNSDNIASKPQSALTMQDSDSLGTKIGKGVAGAFSGIGEGVFDTAAGAADLINKGLDRFTSPDLTSTITGEKKHVIPKEVIDYLHKLAGDDEEKSNAEKVGYGGETLAEFFMGDAALKSLPMAKRLEMAAKTMKLVEGSPRIMQALKIGAGVMSQAALHAAEAGTVQAAQTYVRSGGDVGQTAGDAAKVGAVTAGADATLGGLGEVANATGATAKAAEVFNSLSERAKNAISEEGVFGPLGKAVANTREKINSIFETAQTKADALRESAKQQQEAENLKINNTADSQKASSEASQAVSQKAADDALEAQKTEFNNALTAAKQTVHNDLVQALDANAKGNVVPEDQAVLANKAVHAYQEQASQAFENGMTGENGLKTQLGNVQPIEYMGSNRQKVAADLVKLPTEDTDPTKAGLDSLAGEKLSPGTRKFLENHAQGFQSNPAEGPQGKTDIGPPVAKKPLPAANIDTLIDQAEAARNAESKETWGSPDQIALHKFRNAIYDDIEKLVQSSPNPDAITNYQQLRNTYRSQMVDLDSNTGTKFDLRKADQALNNVGLWLKSGGNSVEKLKVAGRILGPDVMQTIAATDVSQLRDLAAKDPAAFVKKWGDTPAAIKSGLYGPDLTGSINDAIENFQIGNEEAEYQAQQKIAQATEAHADLKQDIPIQHGLEQAQIEGVRKDNLAQVQKVVDDNEANIQKFVEQAKADKDTALEPFTNGFMNKIAEGRASDALVKGNVDIQDVQALKKAAGADWDKIQYGLFQRGLVGGYDEAGKVIPKTPEETLDWWNSMKPDVRQELFSTDNPKQYKGYQKLMAKIDNSVAVKTLLKNGVLRPIARAAAFVPGAVGGIVTATLGSEVTPLVKGFTPFMELIGGALSAGVSGNKIEKFVNYVADHPATWATLRAVGNSGITKAIAENAPKVAAHSGTIGKAIVARDTKRNVYAGASNALGGK